MPRARLVAHVSHECLAVHETSGQFFGRREHSARVVPHVYYHALACREVAENLAQVAAAESVFERRHAHVSYVVGEYAVFYSRCNPVVRAEVYAFNRVAVVCGVVFEPFPVARRVVCGGEVYMSVAQVAQH